MLRQRSEWEKIFSNEDTDKGLISKMYKQHMHLNIKKTNNPNKKMGGRPKKDFSPKKIFDNQQTHEKMLNITNY